LLRFFRNGHFFWEGVPPFRQKNLGTQKVDYAARGDSNGDGLVSATDFNAFRLAYGTGPSIFGFNSDGQTNAADFMAFFDRYGVILVP